MIIRIEAFENGAHANSGSHDVIPKGWAIVPEGMELENFPFGEVEVEEKDGVVIVTKWTPGVMPEVTEDIAPTEMEQLRADVDYIAVMTGVEL